MSDLRHTRLSLPNPHWLHMEAAAIGVLVGGLVLAYSRLLDAWLGRTFFTRTEVWVVGCLALYAGIRLARRAGMELGPRERLAAWGLSIAGLWALALLLFHVGLAGQWMRFLIRPGRTAPLYLAASAGMAVAALAVPQFGIGFALCVARDRARARLFLFLLGLVVGFLAVRRWILPVAGLEGSFRVAALWAALLAGLRLWQVSSTAVGRTAAFLPPVLGLALVLLAPQPADPLSELGIFGRWASRDGFGGGRLLKHVDGRWNEVSLYQSPDFGNVLLQDGVPVAFEERYRAGRMLGAHISLLMRPEARRVALVGPLAGLDVPVVRSHPLASIDVYGVQRELVSWAAELDPVVTGVTARVVYHGREEPSRWSQPAYDVVLIAGSAPWLSETDGTCSRRFLRQCRRATGDDGLVALQLDTRGMPADDFRRVLRDFRMEFKAVQLWCVAADRWLLLGARKSIKAPADRMLQRLDVTPVFRDLVRAGVKSLPELLACHLCDTDGIDRLADRRRGLSPLRLAWHAVRSRFQPAQAPAVLEAAEPFRSWRLDWLLPGQLDPEVFVALLDRTGKRIAARSEAVRLRLSAEAAAGQGTERVSAEAAADILMTERFDQLEIEARRLLARRDTRGATRCFEELLRIRPEWAEAHHGLAMAERQAGQLQPAYWHFAHAVQAAPEVMAYRMDLGRAALQTAQVDEAIRQFRVVSAREPDNAEALYRLSCALAAPGPAHDAEEAVKLAERACRITHFANAEYAWGLADRYIDAGRSKDGLALKRKLRELGYAP